MLHKYGLFDSSTISGSTSTKSVNYGKLNILDSVIGTFHVGYPKYSRLTWSWYDGTTNSTDNGSNTEGRELDKITIHTLHTALPSMSP